MSAPGVIVVTGLKTLVGQKLVELLLARSPRLRVVGLDLRRPFRLDARVRFHRVDLSEPTAGDRIAEVLRRERADALVHLAFRREPTSDLEMDHEVETIGSLHVMNACAAAKVKRLVVASTTMVYGAHADNPNFLSEEHPLRGHSDAHCVMDRVEMEGLLARWTEKHPDTEVTVLRPCWTFGPQSWDHVVRYFSLPVVPMVMGFDPLMQFVHEDDVVHAFERAVLAPHPGVFNIVGQGVLPLSTALRLGGRRTLSLPAPLLYQVSSFPTQQQIGDPPAAFYDYLRYLWVADGSRGWDAFGEPVYTSKEAWISQVSARRMRRYR